MRRTPALLAVVAIVVLGLAVAPAAVAADGEFGVEVEQTDDGATVTVSHNDSAADGATVTVETTDENASYAGTGEYSADENGTAELTAPEEAVEVSVSASLDNHSDSTTVELEPVATGNETDGNASDGAFGQLVSEFVHQAQGSQDGGIGGMVSSFVLENNPAADRIPDHAGPPAHVFGDDGNASERGPPDHAGPGGDDGNASERGPPDHAGPGGDDGNDNGGGPPEHAGPGGDGAADDDTAEDDADDGDDGDADDEDDDGDE